MHADLTANTAIAAPLLSRFDLVLVLLDTPHKQWDKQISTFLLMQALNEPFDPADTHEPPCTGRHPSSSAVASRPKSGRPIVSRSSSSSSSLAGGLARERAAAAAAAPTWDVDRLRRYVMFVRDTVQPRMTEAPRLLLLRYYQVQRQTDGRSAARTTVRVSEWANECFEGVRDLLTSLLSY